MPGGHWGNRKAPSVILRECHLLPLPLFKFVHENLPLPWLCFSHLIVLGWFGSGCGLCAPHLVAVLLLFIHCWCGFTIKPLWWWVGVKCLKKIYSCFSHPADERFVSGSSRSTTECLGEFFPSEKPTTVLFFVVVGVFFFFLRLQSMSSVIGLVQSVQPPGRHKKKNGIMTNPMLWCIGCTIIITSWHLAISDLLLFSIKANQRVQSDTAKLEGST